MPTIMRRTALALLLLCGFDAAHADGTPQTLPLSQDWNNTGLITTSDDWSGVPGITGYRGDGITGSTGADPQTLLGEGIVTVDVNANQAAPDTFSTGGVAEFEITDPAVALQGSGTADAPNLVINLNTTGSTGINVAYYVRDIDGSADDAIQQVALQYRVGSSGDFINLPGGYIADATAAGNIPMVSPVSVQLPVGAENQPLVQVRVITSNAAGSDEWISIDNIAITAGGGGGEPVLGIGDISAAEGDSGFSQFFFTVSLSQPAGSGGVTFSGVTSDGTAIEASGDYAMQLVSGFIPEGETSYIAQVLVSGDTAIEADETFFVTLSDPSGAVLGDAQAVGTILNDDFTSTPIHDIQGSGASSPLVGAVVTTRGIVTGRKGNGFFIQTADADADNDEMTSEGVFVYTGGTPPADAVVGNAVKVQGTVLEFVSSQDPLQPPLTEIGNVTGVVALSSDNPLPTPVYLSTILYPSAPHDMLEIAEGMRVTASSLTVVAPTGGFTDEPDATGTSNGVFHAVIEGEQRPFREPGIQAPDPAPPCCGTIPPIPRWDSNPELIAVDSDALGGPLLDLATDTRIANLTGPLDYGFRRYTILRDPAVAIDILVGMPPLPTRWPNPDEFTIASYNLERFFDTTNDPDIGEPVLTEAAFERRLGKASLGIRDFLNTPDILTTVEVENLSTLQTLAARINADAVAASQPEPEYVAYLEEGNDVGGIDVGFLVKTTDVQAGVDRIETVAVTQLGADVLFVNPDNSTELLNDRPQLMLDAIVHYADGREFPLTVIAVHQRSLNGADSLEPGSNGWATVGERVRAKRQAQAEDLANRIQAMQVADPLRRIAVLGDFNAFEFNDGLTDAMNVVAGTPLPDNETATTGDGIDLVNPDLANLSGEELPGERYSFLFGGNAQSLDHVLASEALLLATYDFGLDHARINADFPEVDRNDPATPRRLSDHDPLVAYFTALSLEAAEIWSVATALTPEVVGGQQMQFEALVTNYGPDAASSPVVGFALDAELPDLAIATPGWTCGAPVIDAGMTSLACSTAGLPDGAIAPFLLTATAPLDRVGTNVTLMMIADSDTVDPDPGNNQDSASVDIITGVSDLTVEWSIFAQESPMLFRAQVLNFGPDAATHPMLLLNANIASRDVTLTSPAGWQCVRINATPTRVIPLFTAACELQGVLLPQGGVQFELHVPRTVLINTPQLQLHAEVLSDSHDPQTGNNSDSETTNGVGLAP